MKLNIKLPPQVISVLKQLGRYRMILVFIAVAALYGYLLVQVNSAISVEPNQDEIVAIKKKTPHIDDETVTQFKQLQDNSVSVQALFNDARTNPFQ